MLYGLYQSAMGADHQALKMDVVSNNIANGGTSSFKRDLAVFAARAQQAEIDGRPDLIPPGLEGHSGNPQVVETFTDFTQGPLKQTGADFDVALMGQGFMRVAGDDSELLTRRGSLTLNSESQLVQVDTGHQVLTPDGTPIVIPPGTSVEIADNGNVTAIDPVTQLGQLVGQIDLVQVDDPRTLKKIGDSQYVPTAGYQDAGPDLKLRQGFIEQSGVQPIKEMLAMIQTSRGFEANMNLIQHQEHTLGQLLQALGK